MNFDYIELLTIRQALLFQPQLNLECVIRKVEAVVNKAKKRLVEP